MRSGEFTELKRILERSSAMRRIREHQRLGDLRGPWQSVAGEAVAGATAPRQFRGGKLFVDVFSAALLQELSTYRKRELLSSLKRQEGFENAVDIVFRHGQKR